MEHININSILGRDEVIEQLKNDLIEFEKTKQDFKVSRGFYISGETGCGKSYTIYELLKELDYSIIKYDASDIRNKEVINKITKQNISTNTVYSMFHGKPKKIAVIMDEIDGMKNNDKGGLNTLIKLIRPKKTKKQKLELKTMVPVICIGNNFRDKKINEIIKVSNFYQFNKPTDTQVEEICIALGFPSHTLGNVVTYVQNDLRKLNSIYAIFKRKPEVINSSVFRNILTTTSNNQENKILVKHLLENPTTLEEHNNRINEPDRTSIALLYHENVIDILPKKFIEQKINFYLKFLDNFTYIDYIDRITFQKQIWILNEISSLIKIVNNNHLLHSTYTNIKVKKDIRFTKVLTKYSTEYNNNTFVQLLCQKLNMDKPDVLSYICHLKNTLSQKDILDMLEHLEISKLDINRIVRYIDNIV